MFDTPASIAEINASFFDLFKALPSDKETKNALKKLIKQGFVKRKKNKYILTAKGRKRVLKYKLTSEEKKRVVEIVKGH